VDKLEYVNVIGVIFEALLILNLACEHFYIVTVSRLHPNEKYDKHCCVLEK